MVIYVAGHGDSFGRFSAHCLLTSDTEPHDIDTVVKVEDLIERIFSAVRYPRNVLLILDVCFAGKGAGEAVAKVGTSLKKAFPSGAGLWVVATADRNSEANDGPFVRAWQALMADKNGAWLSPGGKKHLYLTEFVLAMNEYLGPASPQRVVPFCVGGPDEPTFIKNPWYTPDLDGLTVNVANHWAPKARGDDTKGTTGTSYFTGRGAVLAACRAWLQADTSDGRARVVTGAPGSGKSAVLGRLVLNPGKSAPPLARVHARGQQTEEVALAIAKQLDCKETKPECLVAELAAKPDLVGIVVDSLDEAANPAQLEKDLLRGLAACPPVRLILGVRSRPGSAALADVRVDLDLDSPTYFDPADVEGYAFALLTATRDGKPAAYAAVAGHAAAREVARYVAERAKKSFLYARLASRGLAAADPVDTAESNWKARLKLPDGIEAMFGADLDRFESETRRRFIDLLVPLAYARRRGLPQKHVWAAVASCIVNKRYTNADIRELKERAGFYLIQDTEDGETVHRLFHQSFADYLKTLTRDDDVEVQFAAALVDLVAEAGGWARVREPYLLAAFPSHAAAAGQLGEALADAAFLVTVSPKGLLPELHKVSNRQAWPLAQAFRLASHWFVSGQPEEGARYLLLAALKYNSTLLSERLAKLYEEGSPWWPRWARWSGTLAGWIGVEAHNTITALCVSREPDGETIAVCGHRDGSISIWRLNNRVRLLDYRVPGETDSVRSLAVADCRGEPIVVGVWANGSVRAFRQATGETKGHWKPTAKPGAWGSVTNVVTIDDGGTPLAAIGDGTELLLFELPTLAVRGRHPDASKARFYSLAVARWNNRPVIVSGGDTEEDGNHTEPYPVKLWSIDGLKCLLEGGEDLSVATDLLVFEETGESFLLTTSFGKVSVRRVTDLGPAARTPFRGSYPVAAYPADGCNVIFWLASGRMQASRARRMREVVSAVSVIEVSEEPMAAGADTPGSLWSTVVELDGRSVLLSAEANRVHVWDVVELLRPAGLPGGATPTISGVLSLAAWGDRLLLGTPGGAVSAFDSAGNQLWSRELSQGAILSLAVCADGAELIAGGTDGKIYRLDAATGSERRSALAAGSGVRTLVALPTAWGEQVFAAIEVDTGNGNCLYFARRWSLSTGAEITTWKSEAGPEVLQGVPRSLGANDLGFNGFKPALTLGGYYRWKTLYGLTAFEFEGRTIVALAGPHGEVRVMDAGTLEELVSWIGGTSGNYVHSLVGGVVCGVPYFFGGDEQGVLFRGGTSPKEHDLRRLPQAHRGVISVLSLRDTPLGWVLVSGGGDGCVRFWAPDLAPLVEIEVGRFVTSLAWLGDDLVIGTDRGVVCVRVRWQAVFGAT